MPESDVMALSIDAGDWLTSVAAAAGPAAETAAGQLLDLLEAAGVPLTIDLAIPLPQVASPLAAPAAAPAPVLRQLAESLLASEDVLRPHDLSIAGAQIETDLNVAVDDRPVSRARVRLTLAPAAPP